MTLQQLFERIPTAVIVGDPDLALTGLEYDSRRVQPGEVFFAIRGLNQDGTRFIPEALARGAVAVVSEFSAQSVLSAQTTWVQTADVRRALALASCRFYGDPSHRLKLVGITGTNGKTTTAYLVASILEAAGCKPGLLGTIEYRPSFGGEGIRATSHTTPESLDLQRMLQEIEQIGGQSAVLEVSSHALVLERVAGCRFHAAVLTNVSRDHLDFHGNVESYFAAKERLFCPSEETPAPEFAVLNADDPRYEALRSRILQSQGSRVMSYALESEADVKARQWNVSREGIELTAQTPAGSIELRSLLLGRHNLYNLLAAIATALTLEVPLETIGEGIAPLRVAGRLEAVEEAQPFAVLVDYAHTAEALRSLIASVREWKGEGRLLLVFGCGGDRDRGKRPLMGIAAAECDWVMLTSDNPRSEDPLQIMNDVTVGLQKGRANYVVEPDRARAIERAMGEARAGDTVLIAGKGHETEQIVGDERLPFDDRQVARAVLRRMGFGAAEGSNSRGAAG